jgi:hypothetical protein
MTMPAMNPLSMLPTPVEGNPSASQEYTDALSKIVQALEARASGEPNLFNVAAQFFNPGRSGSFGESLGNVAASIGKDVERAQEYQIPVAQMKAQLAQQKYAMAQNQQALESLNQLYGGQLVPSPQSAAAAPAGVQAAAGAPAGAQAAAGAPALVSRVPGTAVGADGGWLPDSRTVGMMLTANNGDARPVLQEIAKARMKLSEPTDVMKDLAALQDPSVSQIVKMGIATKYFESAVKPFDVRSASGTLQSNALDQIKKLLPQILTPQAAQASTPAAPSPRPAAAAAPSPRPAAAAATQPRPAAGTPTDVKMFTTSDGFQVPMPSRPPAVTTPAGFAPGSSEALEAMKKEAEQSREYMYRKDGPLDKARIAYDAANKNLQNYTNIINSVQNMQGGITAVPLQTWDKLVDAFGFSTPDQYKRMISTGIVDKATKEIVANDLKAAFGGNPTEGERKYLNEALINISDPKELILFAALTRKAIAAKDIARFEYLSQNIGAGLNAEKTFDAWYRRQNLSLFEPELKKMEPRIFGKRPEGAAPAAPTERRPVYIGSREIVPDAENKRWIFKDNGQPVPRQ